MDITIKTSKDIDINAVNEIFQAIDWGKRSDKEWQSMITNSMFMVQALFGQQVVGFARLLGDNCFCLLFDLAVHPDFQKQGIGKKIMAEILSYIEQNTFTSVSLFYWEKDKELPSFYEKYGFQKIPNAMRLKNTNI